MKNNTILLALLLMIGLVTACKEKAVKKSGADIFKENYKTVSVDAKHSKSLKTFGFADDKGGDRDTLNQGIEQYQEGSYDMAKGFLFSVKDSFEIASQEYALAHYYYGLTCIETENYSTAIDAFKNVQQSKDVELNHEAKYYELLCLVITESSRAKTLADEIAGDNSSPHQDVAKGILTVL